VFGSGSLSLDIDGVFTIQYAYHVFTFKPGIEVCCASERQDIAVQHECHLRTCDSNTAMSPCKNLGLVLARNRPVENWRWTWRVSRSIDIDRCQSYLQKVRRVVFPYLPHKDHIISRFILVRGCDFRSLEIAGVRPTLSEGLIGQPPSSFWGYFRWQCQEGAVDTSCCESVDVSDREDWIYGIRAGV
jgi:hypothetical protein